MNFFMNQKRIFLYAILITLFLMLWEKWGQEHPPVQAPVLAETENANLPPVTAQNQSSSEKTNSQTPINTAKKNAAQTRIHIQTDLLQGVIDTQGGNLVQLQLIKFPQSLDNPKKATVLFTDEPGNLYVAQSGLISKAGPDNEQGQALYTAEKMDYVLTPNQQSMDVKLSWQNQDGLTITKIFTFQRGRYDVRVKYQIDNQAPQAWSGQFYAQLRNQPAPVTNSFFGLHTYTGAAISSPDTHYEKISFPAFQKKNLDSTIQGGWLAMQQRYFLGAWIPDPMAQNRYYTRFDATDNSYTLGYVGPMIDVSPKKSSVVSAKIYAGPEAADELAKVAPHLELTVDYGWLWPISVAIFSVMKYIHHVFGNWGWSIVLVTILIKLLFYKLSATSYYSMAKMRKLMPQMEMIKERFREDKQKVSQAMMALYKKEKVNPLSGCLPMLVQIPFFIALYYVLIESVELRQAPFIFWIKDLSIRDPHFVLPILMGVSMFLQQRLSPTSPDPVQAKMMMCLPIVFTVFFSAFPSGLVLYWLVNNCLSALQQWYIMRKVNA